MPHTLTDRYRRWFDYEKDSHAKVMASLQSVPKDGQSTPAFIRAVSIMAHIVAARQLWLFRFGLGEKAPTDFFPTDLTLSDLAARLDSVQAAWSSYMARLSDGDLVKIFEYKSLDGKWFRNTIEDTLTQLFGHSWYHRGQIAMLVRQAGGEPPITDLIYWSRESIPGPAAP
jgi:uncharacterized damage-inducible protein DinB